MGLPNVFAGDNLLIFMGVVEFKIGQHDDVAELKD
jgi:hypothetical protein